VTPPRSTRRLFAAATAAMLAVTLASCASSSRDTESIASQNNSGAEGTLPVGESSGASAGGQPASTDGTIIFGSEGAPSMFDPLYATDGATFKVTRQMTEGLVTYKPGTADIEPALAESWEPSEDALTWTFKMRQGVKFHDGTDVDAAAVCFNFDRMYSQTGAGATQAQYWSDTMGGFKDQVDDAGAPVPSIYAGCTAPDAGTAVITLTRVTSKFPNILGLPSFTIQSPAALTQYDANNVVAEGDSFKYPAYALEHPTGTGPFTFTRYDTANGTIELTRNENYWGDKAKSKTLIFKIIPDEAARKQELQAGTIDGYDLPSPGDWEALSAEGNQVLVRPAFNVLYVGLNPKNNPALKDLKVRQAIAHALNREELVSSQLPEGAEVALEFYPDTVEGWTDTVTKYDHNVETAKSLLAEAGASDLTLNFWWPTEVTRPYMPNPSSIFQAFKADLEAAGITVNETSKPWNGGYLDGVDARQADAFLLGWTGDYNAADNFIGTFFSDPTSRFSTEDYPWGTQLSQELAAADSEPDADKRTGLYIALNEKLLGEYLPAIPISHSPPALVVAADVQGLVPSPLTDERFVGAYKTS
jgi:peptide/nickel transport system substrate-binding protein